MRAKQINLNELEKLPYLSPANAALVSGLPVSLIRAGIKSGKIHAVSSGRCSYVIMAELADGVKAMSEN